MEQTANPGNTPIPQIEDALYREEHRWCHQQQREHQQFRSVAAGTQLDNVSQKQEHGCQAAKHYGPDQHPEAVKGLADLEKHHQAHNAQDCGAHRIDFVHGQGKDHAECLAYQNGKHIGESTGEGPAQNAP